MKRFRPCLSVRRFSFERLPEDVHHLPVNESSEKLNDSFHRASITIEKNAQLFKCSPSFAIPEVHFNQIKNGRFPSFLAKQIKSKGVVVIREAVTEPNALRWRDSAIDYLLENRQWVKPPVEYPFYWSQMQIQTREHARNRTVFSALNSLWHSNGSVALDQNFTYADRLSVGRPSSGEVKTSFECCEWDERESFIKLYDSVLRGKWEEWDPFDADLRASYETSSQSNRAYKSTFRSWKGFLSLAPWLTHKGNLKVIPLLRPVVAYSLLKPFGSDSNVHYRKQNSDENALNGAMVHLPTLSAGDAVFWHPDVVTQETDPVHTNREYVCLFMSSLPFCRQNYQYVNDQKEAFQKGKTPHEKRPIPKGFVYDECQFLGRATEDDLTFAGRDAMGFNDAL